MGTKWVLAGKDVILIETVDPNELNAKFKILRQAAARPAGRGTRRATASVRPETGNRAATIHRARAPYSPTGVIVDYSIKTGTASSFTFTNGVTYWITNSFTVGSSGGTATFQPNACIKYADYAYLMLVGYSSFQTNGDPIVFTSQDDNFYGERLPNSTGNPGPLASPALSIYYPGVNHTVANARFRWSRRGISMTDAYGVRVSHVVKNSRFEYSYNSIYEYLPGGDLTLSGVTSMLVSSNLYAPSGSYYGTFTTDYGVVTNARVNTDTDSSGDTNKNSQSACSFVVVDSSRIVAAFFDTHLSEYGLGGYTNFTGITSPRSTGWAVSTNGGTSFVDQGPVLPVPTNTTQGDAGDPVMARDTGNGRIYLLLIPSREQSWGAGFRLWVSTDNGQNFSLINTNIPSGASHADKSMIAVNNFANSSNYHYIYLAGRATVGTNIDVNMVTCSTNGGTNWDAGSVLSSSGRGPDICIRSNGTVYVFSLMKGPPNYIQYSWLVPGGSWQGPVTLSAHSGSTALYSTNGNGSGDPKRSNSATNCDYFVSNAFPRAAVNCVQDRIYVVYPDLPSTTNGNDHGDIFIQEAIPAGDGSLSWSGEVKVNRDNTGTDQWNPAITVNPAGTELFVGYYSRQDDSVTNSFIKAYGARARLDNGSPGASFVLTNATFDSAPISISTNAFAPLFAGTQPTNGWLFDPVWPQEGMYLDTTASFCASPGVFDGGTLATYVHFMADDYTWASSDATFFYYAWCDRSETYNSWTNTRPDVNIRLGKVKQ